MNGLMNKNSIASIASYDIIMYMNKLDIIICILNYDYGLPLSIIIYDTFVTLVLPTHKNIVRLDNTNFFFKQIHS